jgi:opacity protein-like surface antigen
MTSKSGLAFACAAVLATVAANNAAAEEPAKPEADRFGGAGYLMPGVRQLQLDPLNETLAEAGYSSIGQTALSLGGGGHVMVGRLRIGGEGHFVTSLGGDGSRGDTRVNVSGGYGMFRLGYAVVATERFSLYPMLGVGGGGLTVSFTQQGSTNFDQVLADPGRDASMSRGGFLFDAALGADYRIAVSHEGDGEGFMLVGLRGSYAVAPVMAGWTSAGGSVAGGPDVGLAGPSVHLLIGFGGMGPAK